MRVKLEDVVYGSLTFYCKSYKKPFTEPIAGIKKGFRTNDRFRRHIMWCADNFANLHDVEKQLEISF